MNLDMVPDITMRGQDDPRARQTTLRPPTVGRLAARIRGLAGRPGDWWHLVAFDPSAPVRIPLEADGGVRLWLTTWPPGYRGDLHDHGGAPEVSMLTAGELAEVTISPNGVTERALRTNRIRVHVCGHTHGLVNPGPAYAVTVHGTWHPRPPDGARGR